MPFASTRILPYFESANMTDTGPWVLVDAGAGTVVVAFFGFTALLTAFVPPPPHAAANNPTAAATTITPRALLIDPPTLHSRSLLVDTEQPSPGIARAGSALRSTVVVRGARVMFKREDAGGREAEDLLRRPSASRAQAAPPSADENIALALLTEVASRADLIANPPDTPVLARGAHAAVPGSALDLGEAPSQWESPCGALVLISGPKENDRKTADTDYGDDSAEIAKPQSRVMLALLLLRAAHMRGAAIRQHGKRGPQPCTEPSLVIRRGKSSMKHSATTRMTPMPRRTNH
jgi:hypothetical protein